MADQTRRDLAAMAKRLSSIEAANEAAKVLLDRVQLSLRRRRPTVTWPAITSKQHGMWGQFSAPVASGYAWKGVEFGATGQGPGFLNGMVYLAAEGVQHKDISFDNCRFLGIGPGCSMKWGIRAYDVINWKFTKCEFIGEFWEHGAYLNAPQGVLFEDVRFGDPKGPGNSPMGAGPQIAFRNTPEKYQHETTDPALKDVPSQHIYRRCEFNYLGNPKSERWGAFALSEHQAETTLGGRINAEIIIEACTFRGGHLNWQDGNGKLIKSGRGILVQNRRRLVIENTTVDLEAPYDGWAAQIWDCDEVVIKNSTFKGGGKIEIRNCPKVTLMGNKGDAQVNIGSGAFNQFPMPTVVTSFPITQDYA